MKYKLLFLYIPLLILTASLQSCKTTQVQKPTGPKYIVVKNVNIITMVSPNTILKNATLLITDNRITSINGTIPKEAQVINGKGKWLIPGLTDMHVHVPTDSNFGAKRPTQAANLFFDTQDIITPYIANGVTTIFELSAKAEHFAQRNEIAKGNVIGPRMALAALINGGDEAGRVANTPSDGRQAVRSAKAEGYEFIKLYSLLNIETFQAIVDEANKQGLKTVGHIPDAFQGKLEQAFVPHFGMVAHAEEFSKQTEDFSAQDAKRFAQLSKQNGTWLTPTLTTMVWIASQARSLDELKANPALQYVHPLLQSKWITSNRYNKNTTQDRVAYFDQMIKFHIQLVQAFKEAGVPMVAGTDAGVSGVIGGFSLHDELELLVQAGLTPEEALASATRLPAVWLGTDKETGTVEIGKLADLVLLDENPLDTVKNTRKISGVFVNGQWLDKAKLDAMLADLAKRNTASKDKFDWKKTIGQ